MTIDTPHTLALSALLLGLLGCDSEPEPPRSEPATDVQEVSIGRAPSTEAEQRAVTEAREAAQHLGRTLRTRLLAALEEGPAEGVRVCADEAQALTEQAARERDARVGRSSLRLRNEANAGPEWVRRWLEEHGERSAQGVQPSMAVTGEVARFVAPIAVEGPCLLCHGAPESIPPEVRSVLGERYPNDRAVGYAEGDLRGALYGEVALAPSR